MKRGTLEQTHPHRGGSHEKVKMETGGMLLQATELQGLPGNHQKLGETHRTVFFTALRRNQLCQHFDLGLPASRTVKQVISVCGAFLWQLYETKIVSYQVWGGGSNDCQLN
jgi:hypothetical protein